MNEKQLVALIKRYGDLRYYAGDRDRMRDEGYDVRPWPTQEQEIREALAAVLKAAVALNAPSETEGEANIYWDAENPENGGEDCLRDAVNNSLDAFSLEDLPVTLRYMRARKMHDIEVEVTGYDDEEGWKYQVLPAGPEAA